MYLKVVIVILWQILIEITNSELQSDCYPSSVHRLCKMQCRQPQLRTIKVVDLFNLVGIPHMPYMVEVYRCDETSGCCKEGSLCDVSKSANITMTIMVKEMGTFHYVQKKFTVANHTECCCKKIKVNIIK